MKRFVQTIFLLLATTCCVVGQCYENHRQEGIAAYNHGDYKIAKKHFEYILSTCDDKPTTNDIQSWIDKCDAALKPTTTTPRTSNSTAGHNTGNKTTSSGSVNNRQNVTPYLYVSKTSISCSANGTTEYLSVNCNGNWSIQYTYASSNPMLYTATREDNKIKVYIAPNDYTTSRSDYFYVVCGDEKVKISLSQTGKTNSVNSSTNSASSSTNDIPVISVSKKSIIIGSSGTTEHITVYSNRAWEIQNPIGDMYFATRDGNTLNVTIYENPTSETRQGQFNIQLTDGSTTPITINLWQSGRVETSKSSAKRSSSASKHSKSNRSAHRKSAYPDYLNVNGKTEITWYGLSAAIGTGVSTTHSLMRVRTRRFEVRPIDVTIGYNFIDGNVNFAYHPLFSCYIPTSSDKAMYLGAGPSCVISNGDAAWRIRAEVGLHWEWGNYASSDFFVRYDGMYTAGVSIQWSSAWWR